MHTRPCWVEINTQLLEDNFRFLARLSGSDVDLLAVVKANAYGHAISRCAPAADRAGATWLGVTSVEEAVEARRICPEIRILVIGGLFPGQGKDVLQHKLTPVVWDAWQVDELESSARALALRSASLHLEIDTGMSRQGADPQNLGSLLARFRRESPLRLEGVMTHLFATDESNDLVTDDQLKRLDSALSLIRSAGLHAGVLNVGNSAALLAGQAHKISSLAATYGMKTLMRPGLALYGVIPEYDPDFPAEPISLGEARRALHPVLEWKTQVVSVRSIAPGTVVGYNGTFVATEPMRIALVAAGYADGLDRQLGNRFRLLVHGQRAPLVGRISMDQSVIDVTGIPDVAAGDEVVIIGRQGAQSITAHDHARAAGTIPWEVFTRIGPRVPRLAV